MRRARREKRAPRVGNHRPPRPRKRRRDAPIRDRKAEQRRGGHGEGPAFAPEADGLRAPRLARPSDVILLARSQRGRLRRRWLGGVWPRCGSMEARDGVGVACPLAGGGCVDRTTSDRPSHGTSHVQPRRICPPGALLGASRACSNRAPQQRPLQHRPQRLAARKRGLQLLEFDRCRQQSHLGLGDSLAHDGEFGQQFELGLSQCRSWSERRGVNVEARILLPGDSDAKAALVVIPYASPDCSGPVLAGSLVRA